MAPPRRPAAAKQVVYPISGELAIIERIRRRALDRPRSRELRLGIGDDCAILRPRAGQEIVVTTDFSLEGRHFRRAWHTPEAIGHRALARGLSDLAAMGARPVAAFLSLALPQSAASDLLWIDGFLDGWQRLAEKYGVPLAGGDTAEAPEDTVLVDVMLLGAVPAGRALLRSGARPGDRIFCTGALGGAAAELRALADAQRPGRHGATKGGMLLAESKRVKQRQFRGAKAGGAPQPHLFPEPRLAVGQALLRRSLATAAIDLSDGLSTDLRHLCKASGAIAVVQSAHLPLHPLTAALEPETALDLAVNGGEDYELLFTIRPGVRIPNSLGGVPLTEIGEMQRKRRGQPMVTLVDAAGARSELAAGGWEHLR